MKKSNFILAGALPLLLSSCGGSGAATSKMGSAQFAVVNTAISDAFSKATATEVVAAQTKELLADVIPFTTATVDKTVSCTGGGTVAVVGEMSYTVSGSAVSYTFSFAFTTTDCKETGSDGKEYTIAGNGFTISGTGTVDGASSTLNYNIAGNIKLTTTGATYQCDMDLDYAGTSTSGTISGTACGGAVSDTYGSSSGSGSGGAGGSSPVDLGNAVFCSVVAGSYCTDYLSEFAANEAVCNAIPGSVNKSTSACVATNRTGYCAVGVYHTVISYYGLSESAASALCNTNGGTFNYP